MYHFSLRNNFVCTALALCAAITLGPSAFGQAFSPTLPKANSPAGSDAKPKYSLPRTLPKLEQPQLGDAAQSKPNTSFGGSGLAMPRSSNRKKTVSRPAPGSSTRDSFGAFEVDSSLSSPASIGATSSGNGRELFIDICNVKLMQDIMIPAEEEGLLEELNVKEGDAVPAGKVIGKIDAARMAIEADEAREKLKIQREKAESKSALNLALQKYELAKEEYNVAVRLGRKGSRSTHEIRRAKFSMKASRAEVEDAMDQSKEAAGLARLEEINLRRIQFIVGKMQISTPFEGHVMEILKHPMEYVQKGEDVVRFARMDKLWVEGTVSSDACKPSDVKGQRVTVTLRQAGGEEVQFQGQVVTGPLELEGVGKRFRVRAEVDNRFENGQWILLPGASLSMSVELSPNTASRGTRVQR